jgi:hypothetical protein
MAEWMDGCGQFAAVARIDQLGPARFGAKPKPDGVLSAVVKSLLDGSWLDDLLRPLALLRRR